MKTPFSYTNWYTLIAFTTSWLLMYILIEAGLTQTYSAFTLTVIFTIKSYGLTYLMNKLQHYLIRRNK